jgi:hypothetical protein
MRGNSEHSLKEALEQLVKSYKIEGKLNEVKLIDSWARLMGPMIAHRTVGLSIRDKKAVCKAKQRAPAGRTEQCPGQNHQHAECEGRC